MAKNILLSLLVLLFASSVLYLVPSFSYVYNNKRYSFDNYSSPFNSSYKNLKIKIPRLTEYYVYKMESATKVDKQEDWNNLVSKDQRILEQRLESVIGNNFELKARNNDGKVEFTLYSNERLASSTIFTSTNSTFAVKVPKASTDPNADSSTTTETETLNLKREDFGFAEVIPTTSQDGTAQFGLRMPLGLLLTPEKINLITERIGTQLKIEVGDNEYQGYIDYNQAGTPTNLVLSGITTQEEALYVKAFLNTDPYNLAYTLGTIQLFGLSNSKLILFLAILIGIIIIAIIANLYTSKDFSLRKCLLIIMILTIFVASLKFFGTPLTLGSIVIMWIFALFSIFNLKPIFYIVTLLSLLLLKGLGVLNGVDISTSAMLMAILFSLFIWSTNYVQTKEKKLA